MKDTIRKIKEVATLLHLKINVIEKEEYRKHVADLLRLVKEAEDSIANKQD